MFSCRYLFAWVLFAALYTMPAHASPEDRTGLIISTTWGPHFTSSAVGSTVSIDPFLGFDIGVDWRMVPYFSLGAAYFHNMYSLPDPSSSTYNGILLTPRVWIPIGAVDILAETGVGWTSYSNTTTFGATSNESTATGGVLSFGAGAVYNITSFLGAGAFFRFTLPIFTSLCTTTGGGAEVCGTPSSNMKDVMFGVNLNFNIVNLIFPPSEARDANPTDASAGADDGRIVVP